MEGCVYGSQRTRWRDVCSPGVGSITSSWRPSSSLTGPGALPGGAQAGGASQAEKFCAAKAPQQSVVTGPPARWPGKEKEERPPALGFEGVRAASAPASEPGVGGGAGQADRRHPDGPPRPSPRPGPLEGGRVSGVSRLSCLRSGAPARHQNASPVPGKLGLHQRGRLQPLGGSRESSPGPTAGAGQVAAPGPGCAEEAASPARGGGWGGGRGGPGITWVEAGPGVPGGLSPESGRRRRRRRLLLASLLPFPSLSALPPSPTGMALTVEVVGPAPWGFRISGGRDFHTPIVVTKVTERGKAEAADLRPGDIIVSINGETAKDMLHAEAQSKIRQSPSPLRLRLDRPQAASPGQTNGENSPEVLATRFQSSRRTHTDSQASLSPQPRSPFFSLPPASPQAPAGEVVTSHSFQSLAYSLEPASAEHLCYGGRPGSRQAGLSPAGDSAVLVLPPPPSPGRRSSSPRLSAASEGESHVLREDSEVFKMLQENREARVPPRQSSSFRLLQEALEAEERGGTPAYLPSSLSPQSSLPTSRALATPPKLHTCEKCNTSIANQAVRIQEGRYRHAGCYTCADCGLNLKMRGHFWVGDELYCEKHARQRYSAPPALNPQA